MEVSRNLITASMGREEKPRRTRGPSATGHIAVEHFTDKKEFDHRVIIALWIS
jgi:hypothetical protein